MTPDCYYYFQSQYSLTLNHHYADSIEQYSAQNLAVYVIHA